jgi:hypothetical protein
MIQDLSAAVRRGNVARDLNWLQNGLAFVPCYVANGAMGGCVDEFGLHSKGNFDIDQGRTHLTHVDHYSRRHDNGGHVLRALGHLTARGLRDEPPGLGLLSEWRQEMDLWTATCTTRWTERSSFTTAVYASWATPQLWSWRLEQQLAAPADALTLRLDLDVREKENHDRRGQGKLMHELSVEIGSAGERLWRIVSTTDCRRTELLVRIEDAEVAVEDAAMVIRPGETGARLLALVVDEHLDADVRDDPASFLARDDHDARHRQAVEDHWRRSGMVELPDVGPEARWWPRYAYCLRSSLSPTPSHIQVATGLNANIWGHGFPQDQWYVMLSLPRLGLHELTEAQLHYYNDDLPAYERYTRRMIHREGVFFPWEAPFEDLDHFELDGPTNHNAYQLHNAAYVVAMVWESWLVHRDEDFLRRHADLIEGVARFYAANTERGENGFVLRNDEIPVRSQDECTVHGAETVQPLCAVWSATYTFRALLDLTGQVGGGDEALLARAREILETGYDFTGLLREDGTLRTSATDPRPHGLQKHPPQLNPLTYVPMGDWMDAPPVVRSWEQRYLLCRKTREPTSLGWTFGQFALASARRQDGAALQQDLSLVAPARFADAEWMQFYESSCRHGWSHKKSYYFTVMGLYVMAIADAVIQDYRGRIDILPAPLPRWGREDLAFDHLHLRDGLVAAGRRENGRLTVTLRATRDVQTVVLVHQPGQYELRMAGQAETFASGEEQALTLPAGQQAAIIQTAP